MELGARDSTNVPADVAQGSRLARESSPRPPRTHRLPDLVCLTSAREARE